MVQLEPPDECEHPLEKQIIIEHLVKIDNEQPWIDTIMRCGDCNENV